MPIPTTGKVNVFSSSSDVKAAAVESRSQLLSVEDNVIFCTSPILPCDGTENEDTITGSIIGETTAMANIFSSSSDVKAAAVESRSQLLSVEDNVIFCSSPILPCLGTENEDTIIGSIIGETISALGGNDVIQGNGGPDVINGGEGNDNIQGGEGSDTLFGNDGDDVIYGDSGTNVVFGGGGNLMFGGNGDDKLYGGSDNDVLVGGPGRDFFDCNEGSDRVIDYNPSEDTANTNCENLG